MSPDRGGAEGWAGDLAEVRVPSTLHGERVDRGLALLTGLTRSQAARLIDDGRARVGGRVLTSGSRRLSQGEVLQIDMRDEHQGVSTSSRADGPAGGPRGGEDVTSGPSAEVVYADEHVVVVDKPAGLVVHPGAGHARGTLVDQLLVLFPDMADAGLDPVRPGIVHRIDKGTSGLLMVARTPPAARSLAAQLSAHTVDRRYLAVVYGEVDADVGLVDAPLGRSQRDRVRVAVVEGGRHAVTHYRALDRAPLPLPVTLLACRLETGRTHQIRAHMTAIGHAVLNDPRYARPKFLALSRQALPWLDRPWLHAAELGFDHPVDGRRVSLRSSLPGDLARTLPVLGLHVPEELGSAG